ncbi:uncharacterized protein LOC124341979 isoform X1 [Daphnia pulicaria]|uniref:uncharacterized protein LOC124341979 isoform X1 n=1 Tax=Daphnia pulicaria TaxID=35523 RepID=UPI001EEB1545|nr:uncharacterized protein LOC124341979 isoform X1 [Daphnia pulicaria]
MAGANGFICSCFVILLSSFFIIVLHQICAVTATEPSFTKISTDVDKNKQIVVVAAGTAHPRSLTAPLSSSGVAVELEELLPETMENGTTNHMIILQGETVLLPCKAYSLGQRTVSWIRRRDWHIMSSGSHIYTADSRFSVLNRPGSPDWILMLKSPQLYDSGTYECQIAGGQGQVSHFVELLVWAPVASVVEGSEHHVEAESNIQLHCKLYPEANNFHINNNNETNREQQTAYHQLSLPAQVVGGRAPFVWFHNGRPLIHGGKSSAGLGLVSIYLEDVAESIAGKSDWMAWTSRLVIQRADPADSGNYTCAPWRGKSASVNVFVSQVRLPFPLASEIDGDKQKLLMELFRASPLMAINSRQQNISRLQKTIIWKVGACQIHAMAIFLNRFRIRSKLKSIGLRVP